jgi:hypothetical protein
MGTLYNHRVLLWLLVAVLGTAGTAQAQSRVSTSAATFLTIGTGARGSALGHAYTGTATGADALYWNPAGAARAADLRYRGSVFFDHTEWLLGIDYNAFGLVIPVTGSGVFGLSLAQMDYGRMERRTVEFPEGTGETFGASDVVLGASYAQPLTDVFYIGGTFKYVRQSIYDMNASTMAFDVGFVLESDYFGGLTLAASIMNFGGKMQMNGINTRYFIDIDPQNSGSNQQLPARLETIKWDLPLSFKFGLALPVVQTSNLRLDLLSDAHQTNDNSLNADLGAQLQFTLNSLQLDLRSGYKDLALGDDVTSHMTYGGGLSMNMGGLRFGLDYAYVPFDYFEPVQMIDLRLGF